MDSPFLLSYIHRNSSVNKNASRDIADSAFDFLDVDCGVQNADYGQWIAEWWSRSQASGLNIWAHPGLASINLA